MENLIVCHLLMISIDGVLVVVRLRWEGSFSSIVATCKTWPSSLTLAASIMKGWPSSPVRVMDSTSFQLSSLPVYSTCNSPCPSQNRQSSLLKKMIEALTGLSIAFGGLDEYTVWIFKFFDAWIKRRGTRWDSPKTQIYQLLTLNDLPRLSPPTKSLDARLPHVSITYCIGCLLDRAVFSIPVHRPVLPGVFSQMVVGGEGTDMLIGKLLLFQPRYFYRRSKWLIHTSQSIL